MCTVAISIQIQSELAKAARKAIKTKISEDTKAATERQDFANRALKQIQEEQVGIMSCYGKSMIKLCEENRLRDVGTDLLVLGSTDYLSVK